MIDTHRMSISEATILDDGTVVLIVDVPKLIDQAGQEEARVIDMAFTLIKIIKGPWEEASKKHSSLRTYL